MNYVLVPKAGFEPARGSPHYALNVARLPVPPFRHYVRTIFSIRFRAVNVKTKPSLSLLSVSCQELKFLNLKKGAHLVCKGSTLIKVNNLVSEYVLTNNYEQMELG